MNGSLNLSRALGDMDYKQTSELGVAEQMVTAVPEVRSVPLTDGDEFLLLACDGIWDVLTCAEVSFLLSLSPWLDSSPLFLKRPPLSCAVRGLRLRVLKCRVGLAFICTYVNN